jgi:hypothetical protein
MSDSLVVPEPSKWIDIIYDGKTFIDILEMSSPIIRQIVENKGISEIVNEEFIRSFDFSIQQFYNKGLFGFRKQFSDIKTLFELKDASQIFISEQNLEDYLDILFEPSTSKKFMNIDNFCFSKDRTKIATKDFRILIDDLSGIVPKDEMLNIATVASLMLSGHLEYAIGYDYIVDVMKKYGYTTFTFQEKGYIHINLGDNIDAPKYKRTGGVKNNPKS